MAADGWQPKDTECLVCHENYSIPKILPCAHLLCRDCIVSLITANTVTHAQCPVCHSSFANLQDSLARSCGDFADSFPTDHSMAAMVDSVRLLQQKRICHVHTDSDAASLCVHCSIMLCKVCLEVHRKTPVTSSHKVEDLAVLTPERLSASRLAPCSVHTDKTSELFCAAHKALICQLCATSKHKTCPEVTCLEELQEKYSGLLLDIKANLSAAELVLSRAIAKLEDDLARSRENAKISLTEIDGICDRFMSSVETCRARLKTFVQDKDRKASVSFLENKSSLIQRLTMVTSHLRLVKRVEQTAPASSLCVMVPELISRVTKLETDTSLTLVTQGFAASPLCISQEAIELVERDLENVVELVQPDEPTEKQSVWQFHANHGSNIVLMNSGQTAVYTGDFYGHGIVMSHEPLKVNVLYEVRVEEINKQYKGSDVMIGVVAEDPATLTLLGCAVLLHSSVCVHHASVYVNSQQTETNYGKALTAVKVGSRVGVLVDTASCLHLYVDGHDQGVAYSGVKQPCYAMFDLYAFFKKVTVLPLTKYLR